MVLDELTKLQGYWQCIYSLIVIPLWLYLIRPISRKVFEEKRVTGEWRILVTSPPRSPNNVENEVESIAVPSPRFYGQMTLKQLGPIVWGHSMTNSNPSSEKSDLIKYKYLGIRKAEHIILRFCQVGRSKSTIGATVFRIDRNDSGMSCGNLFWHDTKGEIEYDKFKLLKIL